jgi:hypothetical protein
MFIKHVLKSEVYNINATGECQLLHSNPSQIDKTTLIKNLLDFRRSRDERPPGSLLPKSKYPGNEVAG